MQGVPLLDELIANAWRPRIVEVHGGWRYRWADGVTRRANSVLAIGGDGEESELVDRGEAFYRARGAPSLVQVSTASASRGLAPHLRERGYRPSARTLVCTAAARDVIDRTSAAVDIETAEAPSRQWFDTYWLVDGGRGDPAKGPAVCREFLLAPGLPTLFASAHVGGAVVGTGQIVVEQGWAGVQCMATSPAHRRRGVADSVLQGLAEEALHQGVDRMYLAVMAENTAATAFYWRSGFTPVHEYSYFAV